MSFRVQNSLQAISLEVKSAVMTCLHELYSYKHSYHHSDWLSSLIRLSFQGAREYRFRRVCLSVCLSVFPSISVSVTPSISLECLLVDADGPRHAEEFRSTHWPILALVVRQMKASVKYSKNTHTDPAVERARPSRKSWDLRKVSNVCLGVPKYDCGSGESGNSGEMNLLTF